MRSVLVPLAVAASLAACASGTGTAEPRRDPNVITAAELAEVRVQSVYEAVERLRPQWFTVRPPRYVTDPTPVVPVAFLDNNMLGDLDQLWTIVVSDAREIRYLDPRKATMRFGMEYNSGIIQVITR